MEYKIERANEKDGKEMLEIIESIPSKGMFELLYTRRPDAYSSYMKESDRVDIGVIRDNDQRIILQGACVTKDYYLNGKSYPIGYLGGVRKRPDSKEKFSWIRMVADTNQYLPCDMYYCSILDDNEHAKDVFLKKRENIPPFEMVCDYTTYIINPQAILRRKWNRSDEELIFRKACQSDLPRIHSFLNEEGRKYNFFPKIHDLEKDFYDLKIDNCFLLERNKEIIAFAALWNQCNFKQYVVAKYNKPLNYMKKLDKITQLLGYIPFPKENEVLDFYHLSFFLVKDHDLEIYKFFLYRIANEMRDRTNILIIGINNENTVKNEVYDKIKSLNFKSSLFFINFTDEKISLDNELFIECGLL